MHGIRQIKISAISHTRVMKQKYYFVNIVVTTLFSLFLSNCSFSIPKIVYDTTFNYEDYKVESSSTNISTEEKFQTFSLMPTITSETEYKPLISLRHSDRYIGPLLGLDYDIIYLGYDTEKLISDVLRNRRSLSDALEYPEDDEDKLNLTVLSYTFLYGMKIVGGHFNLSYGIPIYSAVTFGGEKYDIDDHLMLKAELVKKAKGINYYFARGLVAFKAKSKDSSDIIDVDYNVVSGGFRFRF